MGGELDEVLIYPSDPDSYDPLNCWHLGGELDEINILGPEPDSGNPCDYNSNAYDYYECHKDDFANNDIIDCNGDAYGYAYESSCGCIGGNTGIDECADDDVVNDGTIILTCAIVCAPSDPYFVPNYESCTCIKLPRPWYLDIDGDGFHSGTSIIAIDSPGSSWIKTTSGLDCDDNIFNSLNDCSQDCPDKHISIEGVCTDICDIIYAAGEVYSLDPVTTDLGSDQSDLTTDLSDWELADVSRMYGLKLNDEVSGFNSVLYSREVDYEIQYMYVTEGSDFSYEPSKDLKANASQLFGNSEQYDISKKNAILISEYVASNGGSLFFVGHSLGGGQASYNALATGWNAYTYNAAGLSNATKNNLDQTFNPYINATVVKGEIVDTLQSIIGLKAESSGPINYINGPSLFWINFFDTISDISTTAIVDTTSNLTEWGLRIKAHMITEIKKAIGCP